MVAMDEIYGSRARIGYTSPPLLTEVFAYDFYRLAPPGVTLVLTTLGACGLCDLAGRLGEGPVDMETTRIDPIGKLPNLLFGVRER